MEGHWNMRDNPLGLELTEAAEGGRGRVACTAVVGPIGYMYDVDMDVFGWPMPCVRFRVLARAPQGRCSRSEIFAAESV